MKAGYKASHLLSSLDAQPQHYVSKIGQAEADLQAMVLGGFTDPPIYA